jgi:phosphoglycolate phosphatase
MPPYSLILFDVDGTLIDSARCISASLEQALRDCGCACDPSCVKDQIGLPLDAIIRNVSRGIPDQSIPHVIDAYRHHYPRFDEELTGLFPGIHEAIDALYRGGATLAVATNKLTQRARSALDRFGLADRFDPIVGSDQVARPKPNPDIVYRVLELTGRSADEAVMVGDTAWDVEMAHAAGIASCAVTWGNHDHERLLQARPSHLARSFAELYELLQISTPKAKRN